MEKDYENIDDIDDLSDNSPCARQDTFDQRLFDPDDVDVHVQSRRHSLGAVGTEEELRGGTRGVDLVGIENVKNNILVDPIRRAESQGRRAPGRRGSARGSLVIARARTIRPSI